MKDTEKSTKSIDGKRLRLRIVAAILILAVVAASAWAVSLYASYVTGSDGDDSARVARFAVVTETGADNPTSIKFDQTAAADVSYADYKFEVRNFDDKGVTEVAAKVGVVVTFPESPYAVTVKLIDETTSKTKEYEATISDDRKTYTFPNVATTAAGVQSTLKMALRFAVADGMWGKSIDLTGIKIDVAVEQID